MAGKQKSDKGRHGTGKGNNKTPLTAEQANQRALSKVYTPEGVDAGNAIINQFLKPGSLGRVSTEIQGAQGSQQRYQDLLTGANTRGAEQNTALANMKAGLGGYTSPEYQAQREQQMRGIQSNYATSASQLAKSQARGKVYGAAGAAQQANLQRSTQNSKDQLEQDLYVKNIDEMDRRNTQYGEYGRGLDSEEFDRRASATKGLSDEEAALRTEQLEREKLNIGSSNAETSAQIGAITGAGAVALAQKNTKAAQGIQREGIRAVNGSDSSRAQTRARRRG